MLTSIINEVGKLFGKEINIKKTQAMVVSKKPYSPYRHRWTTNLTSNII